MAAQPSQLDGQRFGALLVRGRMIQEAQRSRHTFWDCLCDCGNERVVRADALKRSRCKTCSCSKATRMRRTNYTMYMQTDSPAGKLLASLWKEPLGAN